MGTSLEAGADGNPRFREDSGWDSSNFNQPSWAVEYGSELNGGAAWTAVFQAGRTNAGLTAAANKLTLDLGGFTYVVRHFSSATTPADGRLLVVDRNGTGAYLRLTNGTLNNEGGSFKTIVGEDGRTGRLLVDNATLRATNAYIGKGSGTGSGASGSLTVDSGGVVTVTNTLFVGNGGTGTVTLRDAGATVTAGVITVGGVSGIGSIGGTGGIVVSNPTAVLQTSNSSGTTGHLTIINPPGSGHGLQVGAGTVEVAGDLRLAPNGSGQHGSALISGGSVKVAGNVVIGNNFNSATNGGRIFLEGGRLEVVDPTRVQFGTNPTVRKFYWKDGTLTLSGTDVSLSETQLKNFTTQGAATYGGDRGAGNIATGQTLEAAGTLRFNSGPILLSGGTVRAGTGLVVDSSVSGYGTIDAVVSGAGAVAATGAQSLSIGALGGANAVTSTGGELRVGHLGVDATHTGAVSSGGQFVKVEAGTQTLRGQFSAADGVRVEGGGLVFDGNTVGTSPLRVSAGATARFQNGAAGTVGSVTVDGGPTLAQAGRLQVDGASTQVTVGASVTNNGWIELTNGGTLTVGTIANPGQIVNAGHIMNGGTLTAVVTGAGQISGSGTFAGAVTVGSGAMLSPGNSPGTANFTDLTLGPGGSFELELADAGGIAGVSWDLAAVADVLAITATAADPMTVVLKSLTAGLTPGALAGFDPNQAFSWKFASVTDPSKLTGFDPSKFVFDTTDFVAYNGLGGGTFNVTAGADGLYASFAPQPAAVPEPSSIVLLSLTGLAAAGWRVRRRVGYGEKSLPV